MSTRIRYVKDANGNLITKNPLLVAGDLITVTLVPDKLQFTITNANNGQLIASDSAVSMQMLKIRVKKELRSRGAVFNDEVRTRGPAE
jgi:hypothetical protein